MFGSKKWCNASNHHLVYKQFFFSVDVAIITGKLKTWSKWGIRYESAMFPLGIILDLHSWAP